MYTINQERFLTSLAQLAQIGRVPEQGGGGLERRPFSPSEREARAYFEDRARQAGLDVSTDQAANLSARLGCGPSGAKTLLLGSHLDTVPHGGPYDGALGVLAALEVLTVVAEHKLSLPFDLEAVAFTDEEGRFGDFFGSRAAAGRHTEKTLSTFLLRANEHPADMAAMAERVPGGLRSDAIRLAARDPGRLAGYLELHIEQGPRLEHAGVAIGVVSAIFGRSSFRLTFSGRPDHAGTTPMDLRADALVAAGEFITGAPALMRERFPAAVLTCGGIKVEPGVYNVVPGKAMVLVEYRAATTEELTDIEEALQALVGEICTHQGISSTVERTSCHVPVAMDAAMQEAIRRAAAMQGYASLDLPSGAGHDAQMMAGITPAGIIFVPSKGGRSHCPDEETADSDLIAGATVLLGTVLGLAGLT